LTLAGSSSRQIAAKAKDTLAADLDGRSGTGHSTNGLKTATDSSHRLKRSAIACRSSRYTLNRPKRSNLWPKSRTAVAQKDT